MENNWRYKTLENLKKKELNSSEIDTVLIKRIKELRRIPLNSFTVEDLRILVGQQIDLEYLIPLAIEKLEINIFAEGDYFEGDL